MSLLLRRRAVLQTRDAAPPPGAFAWWSAEDLLHLADNALVSEWPDRSGNGHDVVAVSDELRPTLHHSRPGFKGQPAVFFGGVMQTDWGSAISQPWHAFFAIEGNPPNFAHYIVDGVANGQRLAIYRTTLSNGTIQLYAGANGINGGNGKSLPPQVLSAKADGYNSQLRQNGSVVATGNVGSNAVRGVTLGARFNAVDLLNGWIAEGLLYHGAMSPADAAAVDAYLLAKYL